jgi:hypothetical protein
MNGDLFINGDGLLNLFSKWKKYWRQRRYTRFIREEVSSLRRHSSAADQIVDKISTIGIDNLVVEESSIKGTLINGEKFYIWNSNFWYSWGSMGQVGDVYWDGDKENTMKSYISAYCGIIKNTIHYCPTPRSLTKLRDYLISIDSQIFYENFLNRNSYGIKSSKKSYDLTSFNRDQKIERILNG